MSRSKNRKIADLISGTTFDDGVVAASEVTGLATVATSGSFSDLSNQPTPFDPSTLGTASTQATGAFATAAQGTTADAALPKAGGAVTGNVTFGDNDKAVFGAGSDLQIYHAGSASYIDDVGTGSLNIRGTNLFLRDSSDNLMAGGIAGAEFRLYHNNSQKLATFSGGVSVTGSVNADGLSLGDGDIANFGNSNDLQISHDGTNSLLVNGAGDLEIRGAGTGVGNVLLRPKSGENGVIVKPDGAVELYHNNAEKMSTTTSGIDVTGTVNADALTGIGSIDATTKNAIEAAGVGGAVDLSGGAGSSGILINSNGSNFPIGCLIIGHSSDSTINQAQARVMKYGIEFAANGGTSKIRTYKGNGLNAASNFYISTGTWRALVTTWQASDTDLLFQRIA